MTGPLEQTHLVGSITTASQPAKWPEVSNHSEHTLHLGKAQQLLQASPHKKKIRWFI